MKEILAKAHGFGSKVREALDIVDTRTASFCWREYVQWYQELLDSGRMTRLGIDAIDAAYKEGEGGKLLV